MSNVVKSSNGSPSVSSADEKGSIAGVAVLPVGEEYSEYLQLQANFDADPASHKRMIRKSTSLFGLMCLTLSHLMFSGLGYLALLVFPVFALFSRQYVSPTHRLMLWT